MKIERLLTITMTLLYRRTLRVSELAEQFRVSERTIYRDLAVLDSAGLPLVSSPGRGGGIGLMPGFRLEEQLLSPQGLSLLSSTLEALSAITEDPDVSRDARLARSLDSATGEAPAYHLDLISPLNDSEKTHLAALGQAIQQRRLCRISYRGKDTGRRTVEVLRLVWLNRNWYFQAWCRLREDYRLFRLDRLVELEMLGEQFDRNGRLPDLPEPSLEQGAVQVTPIRVRVYSPDLEQSLDDRGAARCEEPGVYTISWPWNDWVLSWLCGQGADLEVLEPSWVRDKLMRSLKKTLELYNKP